MSKIIVDTTKQLKAAPGQGEKVKVPKSKFGGE
jgi:hypothetical protein